MVVCKTSRGADPIALRPLIPMPSAECLASDVHVSRLQEARSIPSLHETGGTASRPSRIWLSGPRQGKTHFMRVCALALALLHPDVLVGYCMYNECQLTPQQIWRLQGPDVPQEDMPFYEFTKKLRARQRTPFFFSDELEYLYEQRIREPLEQVR